MARLHIGHYNTYMLDRIVQQVANNKGFVNVAGAAVLQWLKVWQTEAIERVDAVCDRILDSPYDVLCLNEVFDEESRAQFIKRLSEKGPYKYYTPALGGSPLATGIDTALALLIPVMGPIPSFLVSKLTGLLKSSGLLLFSRHAFQPINGSSTCEFVQYTEGAAADRLAPKGGAAVVIQPPNYRRIVIGFTHLQADYGKEQHAQVRASQLKQWGKLLQEVGKKTDAMHLIACGDLNIIGNVDLTKPSEYRDVFQSTPPFSTFLKDQWLETHASQDAFLTHSSDSQRLDYMLIGTYLPTPGQILTAHHLMLARNLWTGQAQVPTPFSEPQLPARAGEVKASDHFGVNAVINYSTPHCTPRSAHAVNFTGAKTAVQFALPGGGAYYWFLLKREGSCFLNAAFGNGLEIMVFDPTDLSAGRTPIEPPEWTAVDQRLYGSRFSLPSPPAYVRVRQINGSNEPLQGVLNVTMAEGQSKKFAQYLEGGKLYKGMSFPVTVLNPEDTMWCEALLNEPTLVGAPQLLQFTLAWTPTPSTPATPYELILEDSAGNVLGKTLCQIPSGSMLKVTVSKPGYVYPRIRRLSKLSPPFSLQWQSNLTLFHGPTYAGRLVPGNPGPLELEATDETGSDWAGSDEPVLRITIDGKQVRQQQYENVDSGSKVALTQIAPIGYLAGLAVHLHEGGDATEQLQPALGLSEAPQFSKTLHLDIGNGNYELRYNLSHWLETAPLPKQKS